MKTLLSILCLCVSSFSMNLKVTTLNSPYAVDSILVLDTLIIEEGGSMFFSSGSGLIINSFFKSQGTLSSNNVLSSGESSPTQFDWSGILIRPEASAFIKNTKISDCIECVKSFSKNVTLDSVTILNYGQDAVVINDARLSPVSGIFTYHVVEAGSSKRKSRTPYYLAGGAVLAGLSLTLYFLNKDDEPASTTSTPDNQSNTIKYPDMPGN